MLRVRSYKIVNVDATIIAQRPKLAAHIDEMRKNIAAALGVELSAINVKATTEEGLGFTGCEDIRTRKRLKADAACVLKS